MELFRLDSWAYEVHKTHFGYSVLDLNIYKLLAQTSIVSYLGASRDIKEKLVGASSIEVFPSITRA